MSDCLHCDIHDLLEIRLQNQEANLAEISAKVTEVLADLIFDGSARGPTYPDSRYSGKPWKLFA